MTRHLRATHRTCLHLAIATILISPAVAQQATGVGVGVAKSSSASQSQAVAIGGGNATGGTSTSALTLNTPTTPTVQTVNNTGTITQRNVPAVFAPGLAAAGLETCLGSVSGGGAFVGTGFSFGSSVPDAGCAARLDARTLWAFGLKKAAVARLCLNPDIYRAMPEVCAIYIPQPQPTGLAAFFAPAPVAVGTIQPIAYGEPVEVILQSTGEHRMCKDYDATKHRCRVWMH